MVGLRKVQHLESHMIGLSDLDIFNYICRSIYIIFITIVGKRKNTKQWAVIWLEGKSMYQIGDWWQRGFMVILCAHILLGGSWTMNDLDCTHKFISMSHSWLHNQKLIGGEVPSLLRMVDITLVDLDQCFSIIHEVWGAHTLSRGALL